MLPWGSLFTPPKHGQLWAAVCLFAWLMNAPPGLTGSGRKGRVRRKEKPRSCVEELPGPSATHKGSLECLHVHTHTGTCVNAYRGAHTHIYTFWLTDGRGSGCRTIQHSPLLVKPQATFLDDHSLSSACNMSSRAWVTEMWQPQARSSCKYLTDSQGAVGRPWFVAVV